MTASTFLDIGKQDLKAARCLYDRRLYAQAIFYFQQSVEKTVKAVALAGSVFQADDLKDKVRHNPLKVDKRVLTELYDKASKASQLFVLAPQLRETRLFRGIDMEGFVSDIQDLLQHLEALFRERPTFVEEDELDRLLADLTEMEQLSQRARSEVPSIQFTDDEIEEFRETIGELCATLEPLMPEPFDPKELDAFDIRMLEEPMKKAIVTMLDVALVSQSLTYLGILTFPHAEKTRYPEQGFNPLKFYNKALPIVQRLPECLGILERTFERIDYLLKNICTLPVDGPDH